MKKSLIAAALAALLVLSSCGGGQPGNTETQKVNSVPEETETQAEEKLTLPEAPAPDRYDEELYKNNPGLTPVNYDSPALLPLSPDMGEEYTDKLMIICDSQHYWMKPFGLLKDGTDTKSIITGPEGTMTLTYYRELELLDPYDGELKNVVDIVKEHKPEYLVVALGLNGIATSDDEGFKKDYTELIEDLQRVSPDTNIMCESILPIRPEYKYYSSINNPKITECNSWILKIAEEHGCGYLNTFGVIADEHGNGKKELMSDNLHVTIEGHRRVLKYWRTHAWTDQGENLG